MKNLYLIFAALLISASSICQTTHNVEVFSFGFEPQELNIALGDIVIWENTGGNHNVNGTIDQFPNNPESFGNSSAQAPWTYDHTFNTAGTYNYQCDPHSGIMQGTIIVSDPLSTDDFTSNGLKTYPSPATNYFVLNSVTDFSGNGTLRIFDITGKMVLQESIQSKTQQINIEELKPGVYILNLSAGLDKTFAGKLMVQ